MYITTINIIKHLAKGVSDVPTLMDVIGIKEWQINSLLTNLIQLGYVVKEGNTVKLKDGLKPATLRELAKKN